MELRQTARTVLKILGRPLPLLTAGAMSVMEDRTKMDLLSSASFVRQENTKIGEVRMSANHATNASGLRWTAVGLIPQIL